MSSWNREARLHYRQEQVNRQNRLSAKVDKRQRDLIRLVSTHLAEHPLPDNFDQVDALLMLNSFNNRRSQR